jgi:hypothetical protein
MSLVCVYTCIYIITKTHNRIKTTTILWQDQYYYLTLQKRSSRNWWADTLTWDDVRNYWNVSFLSVRLLIWKPVACLKSCDFSRKSRLRCSCQFPWCAPGRTQVHKCSVVSTMITDQNSCKNKIKIVSVVQSPLYCDNMHDTWWPRLELCWLS